MKTIFFQRRKYFAFFLLISIACFNNSKAQKQNNQWRFGNNGAVDFNTNPPSFVTGAALTTGEGSASVADRNTGALLFYTNGQTIWNALDQAMPNGTGLLGGVTLSSTTAGVIVPKPGSNTQYYLFTIDEQINNNGLRYNLIDMTLNGGLGDIVAGQKNIFLFQTASEKLEVVPAADGSSFWLLTHDNPGNTFYAFKIDNTGIQSTPVVSQIGGSQGNGAGHMKINRQYTKIALGNFFAADVELFDFNNATGVISNAVIWNFNFPNAVIYGVEFSPNGKVLYVSNLERVIQYDISSNISANIESTAYQVSSGGFVQPATMQLAVDERIYVNAGAIDVINCPNKLGIDCGYQQNAIANQAGGGGYGLPKWVYYADDVASIASNSIEYSDSCFGSATQFSIQYLNGIGNINWLFGDANSGTNNTATGNDVSHTFSQAGSFDVRAILTTNCGFDTLFLNNLQVVNCAPATAITGIKIVGDTCDATTNFAIQATGTSNSSYFFWDFGDAGSGSNDTITITGISSPPFPSHTFSAAGTYTICVSYQEPGFAVSTVCRTIKIGLCNVTPPPCIASITYSDTCLSNSVQFSINSNTNVNSVSWNFGDAESGASNTSTLINPAHQFSSEGIYTVTANVVLTCGAFITTQNVQVITCDTTQLSLNEIFIPQAFSPNNDGNNDKIFVRGSIKEFTFSVFNRWGEKVFTSSDQSIAWDGTQLGKELDAGVFVYYLSGTDLAGKSFSKKGNITLVK
jgi:gliding motility-associated-like protein